MCGIVGLFAKSPSSRHGSAGICRDAGADGRSRARQRRRRRLPRPGAAGLEQADAVLRRPLQDWDALRVARESLGGARRAERRASHAVFVVEADADEAEALARGGASRTCA